MKTNKFYYWLLAVSATVLLFNSTQLLAQTCTPPPAGMVAWFPGDGNANDIQGTNNGTVSSGGVTFTTGKVAQAFTFDGTGDVTYSTINAGSAYTVDFWVRPSSSGPTNSRQEVIGNNFQDATSFGQITFNNTQIEYFQGGGIRVISAAGSVPFDAYTHVALTYDGSVNRLYINGNLVSTSAAHTETFNNPIKLGNSVLQAGNARFNGQIDEVEVFSRALSQTEIGAIVTADTAGKCKSPITFVVNTTSDTNDGACNQTHCSLREAIIASNASAGVKDNINFNIPGAGVQMINVGSSGLGGLPFITDAVNINGYSQPGSAVNTITVGSTNAVPLIELNGQLTNTSASTDGLLFNAASAGSAVRGLIINRFANGSGISINAGNIFVGGNFIGTDVTGTAALPNMNGVFITGGAGSGFNGIRIGGSAPAERNLISGNTNSGIRLNPAAVGAMGTLNDTEFSGNLIGTNAQGTAALPNNTGVELAPIGGFSITDLRIGMPGAGGGNVISGNRSDGILLNGSLAVVLSGVIIRNNRIGTNGQGMAAIPNGSNPADPNSSGRSGIYLLIANNVQIGGANAGGGNLISGNFNHGVFLLASDSNVVQGNLIGTNASGSAAIGNTDGVNVESSRNNIIGGTTTGARNLISGNNDDGVSITGSDSTGNVIQGNFIGTDVSGTTNLGNVDMGVSLSGGSLSSIIGDAVGSAGNLIAFNGGSGVFVATDSTRNSILANSIFSNTGLGIDLFPAGVTPNDAGDLDAGANNLQNYPVLTSASTSGNTTTISGTFNSTPNTQFRIEFFFNPACDQTGFGEGQFFIGSKSVTTDASGNTMINFNPSFTVGAGQFITSTATDSNGNTSEFSACSAVTLAPTAATVSISGRVLTNNGRGIRNVTITLTDASGNERTAQTTAFGYYRFDDVAAGVTVTLSAKARRFRFNQSSIVRTTYESITDADFVIEK